MCKVSPQGRKKKKNNKNNDSNNNKDYDDNDTTTETTTTQDEKENLHRRRIDRGASAHTLFRHPGDSEVNARRLVEMKETGE